MRSSADARGDAGPSGRSERDGGDGGSSSAAEPSVFSRLFPPPTGTRAFLSCERKSAVHAPAHARFAPGAAQRAHSSATPACGVRAG
jgi:hypothetical protein